MPSLRNVRSVSRPGVAAGAIGAVAAALCWRRRPLVVYRRIAAEIVADAASTGVSDDLVADDDLEVLPALVAAYVRRSGAVGRPRVVHFRARIRGRIRAGANTRWMTFTGEQTNTYGAGMSRVFVMRARLLGVPIAVLHSFVGPTARMRVKVASMLTVVDAAGPEMNEAETVTVFNDLCLFAPAALIDAPVDWTLVDDHRVRGTLRRGEHAVSAELVFDDSGDLVDFISDDRLRASGDGTSFTPQRWSTPWSRYRTFGARRLGSRGEGRWHAPEPEGEFTYVEIELDDITYNLAARPDS